MGRSSVPEIHELALIVAEIGPTFAVRRLYARIEAGQMTVPKTCERLVGRAYDGEASNFWLAAQPRNSCGSASPSRLPASWRSASPRRP